MKAAVVFSSVTGNTREVAEAVHGIMPEGALLVPVHKAPSPDSFDFLALGFWVRRGMPDPRMKRYMDRVRNRTVAWFGTLAAWPDSPHAALVRRNANQLLLGNRLLGGFLCQGRLEAKRFAACMNGLSPHAASHPMTEERRARLLEASRHPDEKDLMEARRFFSAFLSQAGG